MDKRRLEARVADLVDHVVAGGTIEDDYVECKAEWPIDDYRKTARQIAGLCNAARGDDALWIVGVDENAHRVAAAVPTEMANWWPKVERRFDGLAPEISVLVVPTQHGRVTALSFATDRSPYVVTTDGGSVTHETPWRVGNKTRTANRSQLLSLLVANTVVPDLELINPEISCIAATATVDNLKFEAGLFISAKERAMLPNHRWSVAISSEEWDAEGWGPLRPTLHVNRVGLDVEGPGVHVSDHSGLHVDGSGRVALRAELIAADNWSSEHRRTLSLQPSLRVVLEMPVDRQNRSARTTTTLRHRPSPTAAAFWREH